MSQFVKKLHFAVLPSCLLLIVLSIYLGNFRYTGASDTIPQIVLARSLFLTGDFYFDEFYGPGSPESPHFFTRNQDGHLVSSYPIVPGLLNTITYFIFSKFSEIKSFSQLSDCARITAAVVSALSILFLYFCLLQFVENRISAFILSLSFAVGTTAWSVCSMGLWNHTASLFFLTLSFMLLFCEFRGSLLLAGFFLGVACVNRLTNVVFLLPFLVRIYTEKRNQISLFVICFGVAFLLNSVYVFRYYGSFLQLTQGGDPNALGSFHGDFLQGLSGLLLSPNRGIFVFSPFLVLAAIPFLSRKVEGSGLHFRSCLGISFVLLILIHAKWRMWWGGHCFGYRIITESALLLMLLVAMAWRSKIEQSTPLKYCFSLLVAVSTYFNFLGVVYYPSGFNTVPNSIDEHIERIWDVRNGEIARCTSAFLKDLGFR